MIVMDSLETAANRTVHNSIGAVANNRKLTP
jgi:hypothetical protein